jgi:DNA modification methylase
METNQIYNMDCITGLSQNVNTESVDLLIADPPYYKAKHDSQTYPWNTEEDYLEWAKIWIQEASRVLRPGGTFYLFGQFHALCKLLPILEQADLELRQQIILNKGVQAMSGRSSVNSGRFPVVSESIFMLRKDAKPFIKRFLREKQAELGYSAKFLNDELGVKSNGGGMWSMYTGDKVRNQVPTEEVWERLQQILHFDMPYSRLLQTYHVQPGITDVWDDISYGDGKEKISKQKPFKLLSRLILASSNPGDIVLDPFMGSGATPLACVETDRSYIGFELDEKYYNQAIDQLTYTQTRLPF